MNEDFSYEPFGGTTAVLNNLFTEWSSTGIFFFLKIRIIAYILLKDFPLPNK